MTTSPAPSEVLLLRRGRALEWVTLGWNVAGVVALACLAALASSVALARFGLDSLIEIGASAVVLWELAGTGSGRRGRALTLIGAAFVALVAYLLVQSIGALAVGHRAAPSPGGIAWTAVTAIVMFTLAGAKTATGRALGNPVLTTEGRVTFVDGLLAVAVLLGVALNFEFRWWWADPLAGFVIAFYAAREALAVLRRLSMVAGQQEHTTEPDHHPATDG